LEPSTNNSVVAASFYSTRLNDFHRPAGTEKDNNLAVFKPPGEEKKINRRSDNSVTETT